MPIQKRDTEGEKPRDPHLALLMDESGMRLAIPPGASLWIVEDPSDETKVFPLTLSKVSHKALTFQMADSNGALVEYKYKLTSAKPLNREALKRLQKQSQPLKVQK